VVALRAALLAAGPWATPERFLNSPRTTRDHPQKDPEERQKNKRNTPEAFLSLVWLRVGIWRLRVGVWRLRFGVWRLRFGVWRLRFGV
jgi:hypothetical protein